MYVLVVCGICSRADVMLALLLCLLASSEGALGGRPEPCEGDPIETSGSCNGDEHAIYKKCPNPCPLTCDQPNRRPCSKMCLEYGCECAPGYILDQIGGICVYPEDCPEPVCPKHERYVIDDVSCVRTCGNRLSPWENMGACIPYTGCFCEIGYMRKYDNGTGPCIPENRCPPIPKNCGINEEPASCKFNCPPESCASLYLIYDCKLPDYECKPGCNCKNGYLRNSDQVCIPSDQCPGPPVDCSGPNEVATDCAIECPPQTCESISSIYWCPEKECTPGCNCIDGYLRNSSNVCIPSDQCPPGDSGCNGDPNATPNACPSACPATCNQPDTSDVICDDSCGTSGCECNPGYVLNEIDGICVRPEDCPGNNQCSDPNASPQDCPSYCQPTCEQPDTSGEPCSDACLPSGCVCNPGYILDRTDGECIRIEDCPDYQSCNGDFNATIKECPSPCQATCENPDTAGQPCIEICLPPGCECKPGYIRTEMDGQCIKPEDCPGGSPTCPKNKTYVDCFDGCPSNYCPVGYNDAQIACDPPYPCSPGCMCMSGYLMLSYEDPRCIMSSECPSPGCNGDPNAIANPCPSSCPPTCAQQDTSDVLCTDECDPSGCECKPGYILSDIGGNCILPEQCPVTGCNGDPNATPYDCPSSCPPTCEEPDRSGTACSDVCDPSGCVCNPGYILEQKGGKCVRPEECPGGFPTCPGNKTYVDCFAGCPTNYCPKDDNFELYPCDPPYPCPPGCACVGDYSLLNYENPQCILTSDCPYQQCDGDRNATRKECASACRPTCADPDTSGKACAAVCLENGCECNEGYIYSDYDGYCVKPEDCPGGSPACPANKTYVDCFIGCPPSYCPIDDSRFMVACSIAYPCPPGCACNPEYLMLSYEDPRCVLSSECPPVNCTRPNEEWDPSPPNCYLESCEDINRECSDSSTGPPRCVCKPGYYRNQSDICVTASECGRQCSDPNASPQSCPSSCQPTCTQPDTSRVICNKACLPSGCVCNPGYILDETGGTCIRIEECPTDQSCNGDFNATIKECPSPCPATCDNPDTSGQVCTANCLAVGCECKPGYVKTEMGGQCIKPEDCPVQIVTPVCGPNEELTECAIECPPQSCESIYTTYYYMCAETECRRGCNCIDGYLRNGSNVCIPSEECFTGEQVCSDPNASPQDCPSYCQPTCDQPDTSDIYCVQGCLPSGCVCNPGYILETTDGNCIRIEECPPKGCNGDPNATPNDCPSSCPPTCAEPDRTGTICNDMCDPSGCVCNPGYILTEKGGLCVQPDQCPGGSPMCPANKTYVDCFVGCPNNYCPVDDNMGYVICDPQFPCPPGCACIGDYLLLSYEDPRCVAPSECPPVYCSRPNEIWDPTPSDCSERCEDINSECIYSSCSPPRCSCEPGYYRNQSDICIPASECGCNGDLNASADDCPSSCPPTCAQPDTSDLICTDDCDPSGCVCNPGYILLEKGGQCVQPEQCPGGSPACPENKTFVDCFVGCSPSYCPVDDSRAMVACSVAYPCPAGCDCNPGYLMLSYEDTRCVLSSECPPVECTRPNEVWDPSPSNCYMESCEDMNRECSDSSSGPPRCVCQPGYYRNQSDICVPASECGGAPTCGANKTYVPCKASCQDNYCPQSDTRAVPDCAMPYPCPPGCICDQGYLILSYEDQRCILSSECPPVECTRPNEVWDPNPSNCYMESCEDMNRECSDSSSGPPRCVCQPGFYRNQSDICVPASECENEGCNGDPNAVADDCPSSCPPTCSEPNTDGEMCIAACDPSGCVCDEGYILTKRGGRCVRPDECPTDQPCNGDHNATITGCPGICPATCDEPDGDRLCNNVCLPIDCKCKPGYLQSRSGQCVQPEDC